MKVIVIGAGASGLIAAIRASINHEVILIDSNNSIGKKLLLTGNGKCNYWNILINTSKYICDNGDILDSILNNNNINNTLNYLYSLGIYPSIKDNLYYPYSNSSQSIITILKRAIDKNNIKFISNFKVNDIKYDNNLYSVISNDQVIVGDKLIIATGSKSMPKTGSDGSMFNILKKFNHDINKVIPSLTRINLKGNFKNISNVRCKASISVLVDNKNVFSDNGEMHITDVGISGIVSFNASAYVSYYLNKEYKVSIAVNYLSDISDVYDFLNERANLLNNPTIEELLESLFNYKLMFYLIDLSKLDKNANWLSLNKESKQRLVSILTNNIYEVLSIGDYDNSQVCIGGVSLTNINPETFESYKSKNMYIIGEALDVAGLCGGYNLAFSFISGYIAGGSL
jgi:predicted Rossmann fold flavoprotein